MEGSLNCDKCPLDKKCYSLPSNVQYDYYGDILTICPRTLINNRSQYLISLFRHYRNGHMLYGGGVVDQPYWYLQSMVIIEGTMSKCQEDEMKKKQRRTP
jgi:hypothetical protein